MRSARRRLLVAGAAMERYGTQLQDEQEVLLWLADLLIDTFAADCAVLRARSAATGGDMTAALQADAARVFVATAALRIEATAREALGAIAEGDVLRTAARRAAAAAQGAADQHGAAAAPPRGQHGGKGRVSVHVSGIRRRPYRRCGCSSPLES